MGTTALLARGWWLLRLRLGSNHANHSDPLLPVGSRLQPPPSAPSPPPPRLTLVAVPPTSRSADCTRGRLRLKLTPTLATMACPWPTTPATPVGPESVLSVSPPPALAAAARGAPSLMGFLSLQLTTMLPCLSPSSTTWCRQPRAR